MRVSKTSSYIYGYLGLAIQEQDAHCGFENETSKALRGLEGGNGSHIFFPQNPHNKLKKNEKTAISADPLCLALNCTNDRRSLEGAQATGGNCSPEARTRGARGG